MTERDVPPMSDPCASTDPSHAFDHAVIERLRLERDLWRKLAEARSGILVAYRVGGRVPGKHIDAAQYAERRLSELEAPDE